MLGTPLSPAEQDGWSPSSRTQLRSLQWQGAPPPPTQRPVVPLGTPGGPLPPWRGLLRLGKGWFPGSPAAEASQVTQAPEALGHRKCPLCPAPTGAPTCQGLYRRLVVCAQQLGLDGLHHPLEPAAGTCKGQGNRQMKQDPYFPARGENIQTRQIFSAHLGLLPPPWCVSVVRLY